MNRRIIFYSIVCIVLFGVIACSDKKAEVGREEIVSSPVILPEDSLYQNAENAYHNNDYVMAEDEYTKALSIPSLPTIQRANAYIRLADIATRRGDYSLSLSHLLQAINYNPDLVDKEEWHNPFEQSILFLSNVKALDGVLTVLETCKGTKYNLGRIYIAGSYLLWVHGKISEALNFAREAWEFAIDDKEKMILEEKTYKYLGVTNKETVSVLLDTVTDENRSIFPYNIFYLEKAIQYTKQEERNIITQGYGMLEYLRKNRVFVNMQIIPSNMALKKESVNTSSPLQKNKDIVLLLPLSSGKYKRFTQQIVNGAAIAQGMVRRVDANVRIHYINTEMKDWMQKLQRFPSGTIVGGPLRQTTFDAIHKAGIVNKYIFLTFLQTLPSGVEGVSAWRFYNSPQDQIDALYRFGSALGITSYGILYPRDEYANRMVSLFRQTSSRYSSSIARMQVYSGKESQWTQEVTRYLNTRLVNKQPIPSAPFGATFLPDSFKNATIIIPNLFYNGEQRQVIMGTSLWEERETKNYTKDTFEFAVYPTPWNPSANNEYVNELNKRLLSKSQGKGTRWSGLGFDFVRFSYAMNKVPLHTSEDVNNFLSRDKGMRWTMAPIVWSQRGIGRQLLFIVTPEGNGAQLVNIKQFAQRLSIAYKKHQERIKQLLETQ